MTPRKKPDWSQVRALFEQCVERPPTEREELLRAADAEVRLEVVTLLRESESHPDQLDPERGHLSLVASAEQLLAGGRSIGGYRIVKVLGHGGMSTVYLAEQEHPRRQVALKLLTAVLSSPESLQRFRNEGELLARLQHPGIAQIHDAGVHEEETALGSLRWPFFVMEYVEGAQTLSDYLAARNLDEHQRIELFLQICAAVQHAHERGVVHRDLKPQNILVDNSGTAKVIDFGIARNLVEAGIAERQTQPGDVLGTLHYMSPEQIRGDKVIDTRSDVHALGTVLFEMLTNELPFDFKGAGLPEIGRILTDVAAKPLRRVLPDADVDLELILGKALQKHADQRYATAGSLAEDVRRYLNSEPINARHPSLRYQLRMFARRRRGLVMATLALIVVSTLGGISSLVYAVRASDAEEHAINESKVKDDALRRTFDMAIHTVIDLPRRLEGAPRATALRRTLIAEAALQLEFVEENLTIERKMRQKLARAYYALGKAQYGDVNDKDALAAAEASLDRSELYIDQMLADDPDDRLALHLHMMLTVRRGMDAYNKNRDMVKAEAYWARSKECLDRLKTLPPLSGYDLRSAEANYESCLASVAIMEQDIDREIAHLERCRDLHVERRGTKVDDIDTALALGNVCYRLGQAWDRVPDVERALECYAKSAEYLELAEKYPNKLDLRQLRAKVRCRYGYTLALNGAREKGERHLRWSWKEQSSLHENDPSDAYSAGAFALASSLLGEFLIKQAKLEVDPERARELFLEAKKVGESGRDVADKLLERSREMQALFVRAVCRRIVKESDEALN